MMTRRAFAAVLRSGVALGLFGRWLVTRPTIVDQKWVDSTRRLLDGSTLRRTQVWQVWSDGSKKLIGDVTWRTAWTRVEGRWMSETLDGSTKYRLWELKH